MHKIILLLVAGLFLLHPVLYAVPVEGFSAAIIALGTHMADGNVFQFDELQPFNTDFFLLSKLGAVLAIAALEKLGLDGITAIKLLMVTSEIALLASTAVLCRKWSGASWWGVGLSILIIPGVIESSFFQNDNVLAAALTSTALICFGSRSRLLLPFVGGALFGAGMVVRPDVGLISIIVPFLIIERSGWSRVGVMTLAVASLGGMLTWLGGLSVVGATPIDVFNVGRYAVQYWDRDLSYSGHLAEFFIFFGPCGLFLSMIGIIGLYYQRQLLRLMYLVLPILVINIYFAGMLWQSRQLLGLTPMLVALTAIGLKAVVAKDSSLPISSMTRFIAFFLLIITFFIPIFGGQSDGPRYIIGRIASVTHWREWQNAVESDLSVIDRIITEPDQRLVIVTYQWDPERYLHLSLLQTGYKLNPVTMMEDACTGIAEHFRRGEKSIIHIRLIQSFVPEGAMLVEKRFQELAIPCLKALLSSKVTLLSKLSINDSANRIETRFFSRTISIADLEEMLHKRNKEIALVWEKYFSSRPIRSISEVDVLTRYTVLSRH